MNHNGVAYFSDAECQCAINVLVSAFPIDITRFSNHLHCFHLLGVHNLLSKRPLQCVRVEASISQLTHIKPTYIGKCTRANPMFGVRKVAYNCKMTKQQLIKKAGSRKALAELLGISLAAISQWTVVPKARLWQAKDLRPQWFLK